MTRTPLNPTAPPRRATAGATAGRRWALPWLGLLLLAAGLTGCASLPKPRPEWNARQPVDTEHTAWTRTLAAAVAAHPGCSGVQLLQYGLDALSARLALADTAERCLDVQYYIWKPDAAGRLLADRLLRAADRGVRVRLLLDDVGGTVSDAVLLALDCHTNIEVRLFNPIANRSFRKLGLLMDFGRVNRRMHNKSFTADRLVTIVGGRNVEDRYYSAGEEAQFADFDVLAAGPAAAEVAAMFDDYWFSPSSIPIHALFQKQFAPGELAESYAGLAARAEAVAGTPDFQALAGNAVGAEIRRHEPDLAWGETRLVCDQPEKITTAPTNTAAHLLPALRQTVADTRSEVFIVSPYFIPGPDGVAFFRSLRARGVRVVVFSNSLATTDVAAVHAGYRRYRKALLLAGVELWEIKPEARVRATAQADDAPRRPGSSRSSLHAKSFIFDRRTLFVGSLNLDPRSVVINTEMGLVVEIPKLAGPVADSLEEKLRDGAYRLEFVPDPGAGKASGSIVWHSLENGRDVLYTHEPHASVYRRLLVNLLSLLPIESQL